MINTSFGLFLRILNLVFVMSLVLRLETGYDTWEVLGKSFCPSEAARKIVCHLIMAKDGGV